MSSSASEYRNTACINGQSIDVYLYGLEGSERHFTAAFNSTGELTESTVKLISGLEFDTTDYASIGGIEITGNGWRDIDSGGYLEDFIRNVLFGDDDADEELSNYAEALGSCGEPGHTL
ncbi:hypothetical protein [Neptuniibacter sp. QD37_11]|uniref:hypothetical protein n=1 Tax=Neptuniibacter sp. QD37_11 TaxID=3398209 RepID=UPI0039F5B43B